MAASTLFLLSRRMN